MPISHASKSSLGEYKAAASEITERSSNLQHRYCCVQTQKTRYDARAFNAASSAGGREFLAQHVAVFAKNESASLLIYHD